MKNIIMFIFILLSISLYSNEKNERLELNKVAHKIKIDFAKKMSTKYGFELVGTGGGGVTELNLLSLHFQYPNKTYELPEARYLMIQCVNEFLNEINSNNYFKNHSKIYPFNINNIEIIIGFVTNNKFASEGKIASVGFYNEGKIYYHIHDDEKDTLETISMETYEKALQIVEQERSNTPSSGDSLSKASTKQANIETSDKVSLEK